MDTKEVEAEKERARSYWKLALEEFYRGEFKDEKEEKEAFTKLLEPMETLASKFELSLKEYKHHYLFDIPELARWVLPSTSTETNDEEKKKDSEEFQSWKIEEVLNLLNEALVVMPNCGLESLNSFPAAFAVPFIQCVILFEEIVQRLNDKGDWKSEVLHARMETKKMFLLDAAWDVAEEWLYFDRWFDYTCEYELINALKGKASNYGRKFPVGDPFSMKQKNRRRKVLPLCRPVPVCHAEHGYDALLFPMYVSLPIQSASSSSDEDY